MGDTPETPSVVPPVAPPVAPTGGTDASGNKPPKEMTFGDILEKGVRSWGYEELLGGDEALIGYLDAHPGELDTTLKSFGITEAQIRSRQESQGDQITLRIGLLLYAKFKFGDNKEKSSETEEVASAEKTLQEQLAGKGKELTFEAFRKYWEDEGGDNAPTFPDSAPRAILKEGPFDWIDIAANMGTKEADLAKDWPKYFPYPAGSRVVDGSRSNEELKKLAEVSIAKTILEPMGLKLVVITEFPAPNPAKDEIQLVSLQDSDSKALENGKALWEDTEVPTLYYGAPQTLAALQETPEASEEESVGAQEIDPQESDVSEVSDEGTSDTSEPDSTSPTN